MGGKVIVKVAVRIGVLVAGAVLDGVKLAVEVKVAVCGRVLVGLR
jgi:hypothetical protein